MQTRHSICQFNFAEQEYTTRKYVIPFIEKLHAISSEMRILEIGCGEGGNMKPFLDRGCKVTGVDLSENKINIAHTFFAHHPNNGNLELICDNIYNLPPLRHPSDLIIMRDVIEHIHHQDQFMEFVKQFMHTDSFFFLAFPPWQNPFGGHQQVCHNRIMSALPYIHLLPVSFYRSLLKLSGEKNATITSLMEVKETGLSIERFEQITGNNDFRVVSRQFYFINPNYEIKFNLKPLKQCVLVSAIPILRNFLTTAVYYLLKMK